MPSSEAHIVVIAQARFSGATKAVFVYPPQSVYFRYFIGLEPLVRGWRAATRRLRWRRGPGWGIVKRSICDSRSR